MVNYVAALKNIDICFASALTIKNLSKRERALQRICLDAGALQLLDCAEGSIEDQRVSERRRVYCAALEAVRKKIHAQETCRIDDGRFIVRVPNDVTAVVADQRYVTANAEALRRYTRNNPYDDARRVFSTR